MLFGLGTALVLTGCPNPQTYGTPRTTPKGKVTHTVAPEVLMVTGNATTTEVDPTTGATTTDEEPVSVTVPIPPSYKLRVGVADRVDIGVSVPNMSSLGADVKVNPVRGDFDLAVDPGVQWFGVNAGDASFNVFYLHLPLMLGINFSPDTTLVLTPGVLYSAVMTSADDVAVDGEDAVYRSSGLAARFGVGFQYRVSPKFALHPEVTGIRGLTGDYGETEGTIVLFGLGFNIANMPDYSDVGGGGAAPPAAQ